MEQTQDPEHRPQAPNDWAVGDFIANKANGMA